MSHFADWQNVDIECNQGRNILKNQSGKSQFRNKEIFDACTTHTLTQLHKNTLNQQHLKLSPNIQGNVFLVWVGLSGVVHRSWSRPSVINCHNASKLTNGLCVKEGPLIYWSPLVDLELIISIMAGFQGWAFSPANARFFGLTLHRFPGSCRKPYCLFSTRDADPHFTHTKVHVLHEPTRIVCLWTQGHTHFISYKCTASRSHRRDTIVKVISSDIHADFNTHDHTHSSTHSTEFCFPSSQIYLETHTALPYWHDNPGGEIFHMWH